MIVVLNTSFNRKHSTVLPADSAARVVSILHDHENFIRLNPLVTEIELVSQQNTPFPLPDEGPLPPPPENPNEMWKTYDVVDIVPRFGGFWNQRLEYTTTICNLDNGMKGMTNPGLGIHIESDWLVEKGADGELLLIESAKVDCNVILVPLIKFPLYSSHDKMHNTIVEMVKQTPSAP